VKRRTLLQQKAPLRRAAQLKRSSWFKRRRALKSPTSKYIALDELDSLARQIILIRDGFKCVRCGAGPKPGRGGGLHASHILPKGSYPSMRYELKNLIALCWSCHLGPKGWHKNPLEATKWLAEKYGQDRIEHLRYLAFTRHKTDKAALKVWLTEELAKLQVPQPVESWHERTPAQAKRR